MKELVMTIILIALAFAAGFCVAIQPAQTVLKEEAVEHGKAEWFISDTNKGTTEWRWKP